MTKDLVVRFASAVALVGVFIVGPAWLCLLLWYAIVVVFGTSLFLERVQEDEVEPLEDPSA
jgi:Flp pilus assembly protein TadB